MKRDFFWRALVVVVLLFVFAFRPQSLSNAISHGEIVVALADASFTHVEVTSRVLLTPPAPSASASSSRTEEQWSALKRLLDYTLEAMVSWRKPGRDSVSYPDVAFDMAEGCLAADALWSEDTTRRKCSIQLATLAYFEGAFLSFVDDGRVNDAKWREQAFKNGITWSPNISDDGEAYSLWQIHPEKGIVLTSDGEWKHNDGASTDVQGNRKPGVITGPDLTKNRKLAVKVAIAFIRKSLRVTRSLVGYTGETSKTGFGKARTRELFTANWVKRHPF